MNQQLWQAHLENVELRRRIQSLHVRLTTERRRAEMWKHRALNKPKRQNAGVRAVSGREPAHQPPSQRGGL